MRFHSSLLLSVPSLELNGLLRGVAPEIVGSISFGGLRAYCAGYAVDTEQDEHLVYLALIGYRTAVRSVWAALLEHQPIEIAGKLLRRAEGTYLYRTISLPETGLENMALLYQQASIQHLEPNQPVYLLNASDEPPHRRFVTLLNRAIVAPLLPHWAEPLWRAGRRARLIQHLDAVRGGFAWKIDAADEAWLELVRAGIARGELKR